MDDSEPLSFPRPVIPGQWDFRENSSCENKGTKVLTSHFFMLYSFPATFTSYPHDEFVMELRQVLLS